MGKKYLDFEKPIAEIEKKIEELKKKEKDGEVDRRGEILQLQQILNEKRKEIYSNLSAWQIVQVARHPDRPHT
ncbi:MAG TPA: acetyl-CoA carboxylase carboxyl transferase subunit alpha, partial [Firmicutes bacterium]|nr:acetyl-CoA carboxylase carboxyl transferase subunit alpha [Bacillota bacterium]